MQWGLEQTSEDLPEERVSIPRRTPSKDEWMWDCESELRRIIREQRDEIARLRNVLHAEARNL
jgi:hypothetical protein